MSYIALIKCGECGAKISEDAKQCPHCGYRGKPGGVKGFIGGMFDGVILIYTQGIEDRDKKLKSILTGLRERGLYKKDALSYRRGCLNFDELIGNWKEWYELEKDHPG